MICLVAINRIRVSDLLHADFNVHLAAVGGGMSVGSLTHVGLRQAEDLGKLMHSRVIKEMRLLDRTFDPGNVCADQDERHSKRASEQEGGVGAKPGTL